MWHVEGEWYDILMEFWNGPSLNIILLKNVTQKANLHYSICQIEKIAIELSIP